MDPLAERLQFVDHSSKAHVDTFEAFVDPVFHAHDEGLEVLDVLTGVSQAVTEHLDHAGRCVQDCHDGVSFVVVPIEAYRTNLSVWAESAVAAGEFAPCEAPAVRRCGGFAHPVDDVSVAAVVAEAVFLDVAVEVVVAPVVVGADVGALQVAPVVLDAVGVDMAAELWITLWWM